MLQMIKIKMAQFATKYKVAKTLLNCLILHCLRVATSLRGRIQTTTKDAPKNPSLLLLPYIPSVNNYTEKRTCPEERRREDTENHRDNFIHYPL